MITNDKGDMGRKGDKGDKGGKGDMGRVGDTGRTGNMGDTGLTGVGDTGEAGQGLKGDTGAQGERGTTGITGTTGTTGEQGEQGEIGHTGTTGAQGDAGTQGEQGEQGVPGVSLTIDQLESYVRRLEGRYQRVAMRLTIAVVVTAIAVLGTLAWTAATQRARTEERREAVTRICEAQNATNAGIVDFLRAVSPENVNRGIRTFSIRDCQNETDGSR